MENFPLIGKVLIVVLVVSVIMVSLTALQARRQPVVVDTSYLLPISDDAAVAPVALSRVLPVAPVEGDPCPVAWQPGWARELVAPPHLQPAERAMAY